MSKSTPGPEPERLRIDGLTWQQAMHRASNVPVRPGEIPPQPGHKTKRKPVKGSKPRRKAT